MAEEEKKQEEQADASEEKVQTELDTHEKDDKQTEDENKKLFNEVMEKIKALDEKMDKCIDMMSDEPDETAEEDEAKDDDQAEDDQKQADAINEAIGMKD